MASYHLIGLSEIMGSLPEIEDIGPPASWSVVRDDLFICALGFEERCLQIPRFLARNGYSAEAAVFLRYSTNTESNEQNEEQLLEYLNVIAIERDVRQLECDELSYLRELNAVIDGMRKSRGSDPTITLDISVMANRALIRSLSALLVSDVSLRVVYSEARLYHPTKREFEEMLQSLGDIEGPSSSRDGQEDQVNLMDLEWGVSDVAVSPEHPGQKIGSMPDSILLFPSFRFDRSRRVINHVDQSLAQLSDAGDRLIWMVGVPHSPDDRWRVQAMKDLNGLTERHQVLEVSTFSYKETLETLEQTYKRVALSHNVTLSPLGSKLQALGTALFCYLHPDVTVVFAVPTVYNAPNYSQGCKHMWKIEFGPMRSLRERLDGVGMGSILD